MSVGVSRLATFACAVTLNCAYFGLELQPMGGSGQPFP